MAGKTARFLLGKLLRMLSLLLAACLLSFFLLSLSPIDPVEAYVGASVTVSEQQREEIAAHWGLDKPPAERFGLWLSSIAQGDFGTSLLYRRPVLDVIGERFLASLWLMGIAWIFSGLIGLGLGILAGRREGSLWDKGIRGFCLLLSSTPTFWVGMVLLLIFAVWLGWFPVGLSVPIGVLEQDVTLFDRLSHVILPALTLSLAGMAPVALHTREKLMDINRSDYMLYARARGEGEWTALRRHGLRNLALPAVTLQFASFAELFGGSVLAEQVFSYPGLGRAATEAGLNGDLPLLLGIVLFSTLFVFIGNSIADLLTFLIDPRIRRQKRGGV